MAEPLGAAVEADHAPPAVSSTFVEADVPLAAPNDLVGVEHLLRLAAAECTDSVVDAYERYRYMLATSEPSQLATFSETLDDTIAPPPSNPFG